MELIVAGLANIILFPFLLVVGTSIWVWIDARAKGLKGQRRGFFDMGPFVWFLCCLGLWIIAFPAYLAVRN